MWVAAFKFSSNREATVSFVESALPSYSPRISVLYREAFFLVPLGFKISGTELVGVTTNPNTLELTSSNPGFSKATNSNF